MIEINKKYKIINSIAGNDGKIVTVTGYLGEFSGFVAGQSKRYSILEFVRISNGGEVNHVGEGQLKAIDDSNSVTEWSELSEIWRPEHLTA